MADDSGDEVVEVTCRGGGCEPGAYAAVLKRNLDLYCAAVARSMEAKSQESSLGYSNSQASNTSQLISQASFHGNGDKASLLTNCHVIDNADSQGKAANNGASKKQSDDDCADFEGSTNPANPKKMRRMMSNRESARRSRKRKQIHLNDLEAQFSGLTAENASLLKRLADMTEKYQDVTLDNHNLTVDGEMMRRKVHIAEEAVRRVTGASMLLLPTTSEMPLTSCLSDAASASVPVQDSMQYLLQAPLQDDRTKLPPPNGTIPLRSGEMHTMVSSLRRVASLENLQKRIHSDSISSDTPLPFSDPEARASDK